MNSLSHLLDVGLDTVSNKTHITNEMLDAIIKKKFELLHPTKAIGFITILEREYNIDFTEWKEEFEEYKKENPPKNNELFIYAKEGSTKKSLSFGVIVVVLFLIVAVVFIFYTNQSKSKNSNPSFSLSSKPIQEAKQKLESKDISFAPMEKSEVVEEEIIETNESTTVQHNSEDTNETIFQETNSHESLDENVEENQTIIKEDTDTATDNEMINDNIKIDPNGQIWIGLIDLETYKKSQILKDEPLEINGSKEYLILTGHGMFTLTYKDINLSYNSQYPVRFIFKEKNLKEIDKAKFNELNRGNSW